MNYLALIGDMVDSRHLDNREAVQAKLADVLEQVNERYTSSIKSRFLITIGDEFQGLLVPRSNIYYLVCEIMEHMYPVKIRFGIGVGKISTELKETAIGMDGPAFHAARLSLENLKKGKESAIKMAGTSLDASGLDGVNALLASLGLIRQFWPESFKKALPLVRQGLTQQEIADRMNLTQATISWTLHKAKWRDVKAIERTLEQMLDGLLSI